jgi:uncharacterized protein (TIGR02757 family)
VSFRASSPTGPRRRPHGADSHQMRGSVAHQRRVLDRLPVPGPDDAVDPVHLVRGFADPLDQEIAGIVAALFAYGQVKAICRTVEWILGQLAPSPRQALLERRHLRRGWGAGFRYRFNSRSDLIGLCEGIASMTRDRGGLGKALALHRADHEDTDAGLASWVNDLRLRACRAAPLSYGLRHLLPDPARGGACKRWRLYLRWMIRPADGIDLGVWSHLMSPAELVIPLDAHWERIGPRLGLTSRRTAGAGMAKEITRGLRKIRPDDPLRYDYPICHLGMRGGCPPRLGEADCRICPLRSICPTAGQAVLQVGGP